MPPVATSRHNEKERQRGARKTARLPLFYGYSFRSFVSGSLVPRKRRAQTKNKLPSPDIEVLLSPLLRVWVRVSSCSGTLSQAARQHTLNRNRNALRQKGTGLSGGPACGVWARKCQGANAIVRTLTFLPRPHLLRSYTDTSYSNTLRINCSSRG